MDGARLIVNKKNIKKAILGSIMRWEDTGGPTPETHLWEQELDIEIKGLKAKNDRDVGDDAMNAEGKRLQ